MATDLRLNWLVATALGGWVLYLLAPVLTPFVAAALLAYIGDPLADRLQRMRMPRTVAVVAVFGITFFVVSLLVLLVGPLIKLQVGLLISALPEMARQVEAEWLPPLFEWLKIDAAGDAGIGAFLANYSDMVSSWSGSILRSVGKSGTAVAMAVFSLFLVPILTFYMLRDWDSIVRHLAALLPTNERQVITQLAVDTDKILGAFLRGQLLVMLALALIYSLGLSVVGVKFAIAIGVVSGLVSFVPYLGFVFGIMIAGLTVVLEPNPLWPLLGVVVTFTVAQLIEGSVLTPKLVGDRIGLHPVIVIFAIAAGGQLFGFFGILLALPAAAALSVFVRFAYDRYLREHPELDLQDE